MRKSRGPVSEETKKRISEKAKERWKAGVYSNKTIVLNVGDRFNWLVVVKPNTKQDKHKFYYSLYKCDCGIEKEICNYSVRKGVVKSCVGYSKRRITTHGMSKSREYKTWRSMITRCFNKNSPDYARYGGRGITVCDKWLDFDGFYDDMGNRPNNKTIDRIDVNGNYAKENCKWSDNYEQANNRSNTKKYKLGDFYGTIAEISTYFGVSYSLISARIKRGWNIKHAVSLIPGAKP